MSFNVDIDVIYSKSCKGVFSFRSSCVYVHTRTKDIYYNRK